ncbi:ribonuclease E activity regulator RraA [Aestuariispira insulae]|nr:ribonuclease E activity regulator RraA [Aestuariispira insulae]
MTDKLGRATADIVDDFQEVVESCQTQFLDLGGRVRFSGPVTTVKCRNDNALLKSILQEESDCGILVIDGGGNMETALMGDLIAAMGRDHGWSGAVILGPIRDSRAIGEMDFGVKALGTNPMKSAKTGAGERDVPVTFGGVTFTPGGWLYADEDGVLFHAKGPLPA